MSKVAIVPWHVEQHNEPWCPLSIYISKISLQSKNGGFLSAKMTRDDLNVFELTDILLGKDERTHQPEIN
jgi:hypothetical protein